MAKRMLGPRNTGLSHTSCPPLLALRRGREHTTSAPFCKLRRCASDVPGRTEESWEGLPHAPVLAP